MTPSPPSFRLWLFLLTYESLRYLVVAGGAFTFFWIWRPDRYVRRRLDAGYQRALRFAHDLRWSACTVVIFSLMGLLTRHLAVSGIVKRYETIAEHGWAYLALSIVVLIVLQDTWFYWTHRAMHHRLLYRLVHRTHHQSVHTSPWTAYAFSPLEALTHAVFVPLVWTAMPLHEAAVFLFLLFMITRNVLGHLAIELFPSGFTRHPLLGWTTTTMHHALHHRHFTSSYGLYFTAWDRLMGTSHPRYHEEFERVVSG